MSASIDRDAILEAQEFFGLPDPALVEKDYWVVHALAAISKLKIDGVTLVFAGGTALGRAHRLIRRMSEDVDLKIVAAQRLNRARLSSIKRQVSEALQTAGFKFDPENEEHLLSRNSNRFTQFRIPYPTVLGPSPALRPGIQIELTESGLLEPAVMLPVSSFVAEAHGMPAEISAMPCVSVVQTLAEKFVGVTRRVGEQRATSELSDATLLRHFYDVHIGLDHCEIDAMVNLIGGIMASDASQFGNKYPQYAADPWSETLAVLAAMDTDPLYADQFARFHAAMVYGAAVDYQMALKSMQMIAAAVAATKLP